MDVVSALEALQGRGIEVLSAIAVGRLTRQRLIDLGHPQSTARAWARLSEVFFGPTRSRRLQAAAVAAARDGGLSVDALRAVDKHARKLLKDASVSEWELRLELCGLTGTVDEIDRQAAARVREINRTVADAEKKAFGRRSLKGGKNTDAQGLRTITVTLPERLMATTLARLRVTAGRLRGQDAKLSYEQAMADAFLSHVGAGAGVAAGTVPPIPLVVIGLPDWARIHRQEGDETIFALTDGTTVTGAELVAGQMAEHHLVGVYDPVEGPVNLYRSQRLASGKQRMLLAAETILCPTPGCTTSADECQVHHLVAWQHGGETNVASMSVVCRVHNARNDDDPNAPPRNGRLERQDGGVVFHPPDGRAVETNRHPIRELSAMALVRG
ncbi:HNH endonuclease signature motif containing protein [Corynebacterium suedekumii]|uniref:HNH endonuclease signature motif containing protein n=1 Tax=Corynebacterium suedekumii TaxID=3049801 RepID=A0ABY8VI17_9CORY|nr:HNH endonuclease signature motif containing protein [Corynebacterium suedekumii]WIM69294.1 HNH endonuclease signature motif containing protein [Corynebacterium suedekumii]